MKKKEQAPLPMPIGTLVRYYDEGWRTGHFVDMKGKLAVIQPIGPIGKQVRRVNVPLTDVQIERGS